MDKAVGYVLRRATCYGAAFVPQRLAHTVIDSVADFTFGRRTPTQPWTDTRGEDRS